MADIPRCVQRAVALLALASLLTLVPGCNNNGGSNPPVMLTGCLTFAAAAPPAAGTVVARPAAAGSTCDVAVVEMIVSDVSDLYGSAFRIDYDPAVVALTGAGASSSGSILGAGLILDLGSTGVSGQISLGLSRTSPPGVDVVGPQLLVTLTFIRVTNASSSGSLSFADQSLFDSSPQPMEIPGIGWSGGTFVVTAQ